MGDPSKRETRLQAAIVRGREIIVLEVLLDDGRHFWLLPGGGREPEDPDDAASVAREVYEELALEVTVDRLLLEAAAHPDDDGYRQYRTFLCRAKDGSVPTAGIPDGTAVIRRFQWLHLDDERSWGAEITDDRYLHPQLLAIRDAMARPASA